MFSRSRRILQRYFIPGFVSAIFHTLRSRCMVSLSSKVQCTRRIRFGKGTVVKSYVVVQSSGGSVRTGRNCSINNFCHLAAIGADIILGDQVRIGPHAVIVSGRRKYLDRDRLIYDQGYTDRGVRIGNDVMIGAGAKLFECHIGDGAVIGAGAVVTKDVEPYTIVVGVPARVVGKRQARTPAQTAR